MIFCASTAVCWYPDAAVQARETKVEADSAVDLGGKTTLKKPSAEPPS